jgi:hypothetical protein
MILHRPDALDDCPCHQNQPVHVSLASAAQRRSFVPPTASLREPPRKPISFDAGNPLWFMLKSSWDRAIAVWFLVALEVSLVSFVLKAIGDL